MKRIAAQILILALLTSGIVPPARAESASAANPSFLPLPSAGKIEITSASGRIAEAYEGKSPQTVIVIQDAHAIAEAQRNIGRLISGLSAKYGTGLVALEGASSRLDPQIFKSFPDQDDLKKVFDGYVEKGELSGAAAAALLGETSAQFAGVEDWGLYEEGLRFYLLAAEKQNAELEKLAKIRKQLEREKATQYSPKLLEVDKALESFDHNAGDLGSILKLLAQIHPPAKGSELSLVLEESSQEKQSDSQFELEIKSLAEKTKEQLRLKHLAPDVLQQFNAHYQAFLTSSISAGEYAAYLEEFMQRNAPELLRDGRPGFSGRFRTRVQNHRRLREIRGTKFFDDFQQYAREVKASLFRNDAERGLDAQSENLSLLDKLARLELTRGEWDELKSVKRESWIVNRKNFEQAVLFYENAEKREAALFGNLMKLFPAIPRSTNHDARSAHSAILVAGGFHAEGLTSRLKERGISYALVIPEIGAVPDETSYGAQMRGDVSWKNYFRAENGKVDLYKAFLRAARDRLLAHGNRESWVVDRKKNDSLSTIHDSRLLKLWRDQIIRDLAGEKRVEVAGEYTSLLDEIAGEAAEIKSNTAVREKVETFIRGLLALKDRNQISEENIFQLLKSSASASLPAMFPPPTSVPAPGSLLDTQVIAGTTNSFSAVPVLPVPVPNAEIEGRSELRTTSSFSAEGAAQRVIKLFQNEPGRTRLPSARDNAFWGASYQTVYNHQGEIAQAIEGELKILGDESLNGRIQAALKARNDRRRPTIRFPGKAPAVLRLDIGRAEREIQNVVKSTDEIVRKSSIQNWAAQPELEGTQKAYRAILDIFDKVEEVNRSVEFFTPDTAILILLSLFYAREDTGALIQAIPALLSRPDVSENPKTFQTLSALYSAASRITKGIDSESRFKETVTRMIYAYISLKHQRAMRAQREEQDPSSFSRHQEELRRILDLQLEIAKKEKDPAGISLWTRWKEYVRDTLDTPRTDEPAGEVLAKSAAGVRSELRSRHPLESEFGRNKIASSEIVPRIPANASDDGLIAFFLNNYTLSQIERQQIFDQMLPRIGDMLSASLFPNAARHGEGITWSLAPRAKAGFFSTILFYDFFSGAQRIKAAVNLPAGYGYASDVVAADVANQVHFMETGRTAHHPGTVQNKNVRLALPASFNNETTIIPSPYLLGRFILQLSAEQRTRLTAILQAVSRAGMVVPIQGRLNAGIFNAIPNSTEIHFSAKTDGTNPVLWEVEPDGSKKFSKISNPQAFMARLIAVLTYYYEGDEDHGKSIAGVFPNAGDFVYQKDPASGKDQIYLITMRERKEVSTPEFIDGLIHLYAMDEGRDAADMVDSPTPKVISAFPLPVSNPAIAFHGIERGLTELHGAQEGRRLTRLWLEKYAASPLSVPYRSDIAQFLRGELPVTADYSARGFRPGEFQRSELRSFSDGLDLWKLSAAILKATHRSELRTGNVTAGEAADFIIEWMEADAGRKTLPPYKMLEDSLEQSTGYFWNRREEIWKAVEEKVRAKDAGSESGIRILSAVEAKRNSSRAFGSAKTKVVQPTVNRRVPEEELIRTAVSKTVEIFRRDADRREVPDKSEMARLLNVNEKKVRTGGAFYNEYLRGLEQYAEENRETDTLLYGRIKNALALHKHKIEKLAADAALEIIEEFRAHPGLRVIRIKEHIPNLPRISPRSISRKNIPANVVARLKAEISNENFGMNDGDLKARLQKAIADWENRYGRPNQIRSPRSELRAGMPRGEHRIITDATVLQVGDHIIGNNFSGIIKNIFDLSSVQPSQPPLIMIVSDLPGLADPFLSLSREELTGWYVSPQRSEVRSDEISTESSGSSVSDSVPARPALREGIENLKLESQSSLRQRKVKRELLPLALSFLIHAGAAMAWLSWNFYNARDKAVPAAQIINTELGEEEAQPTLPQGAFTASLISRLDGQVQALDGKISGLLAPDGAFAVNRRAPNERAISDTTYFPFLLGRVSSIYTEPFDIGNFEKGFREATKTELGADGRQKLKAYLDAVRDPSRTSNEINSLYKEASKAYAKSYGLGHVLFMIHANSIHGHTGSEVHALLNTLLAEPFSSYLEAKYPKEYQDFRTALSYLNGKLPLDDTKARQALERLEKNYENIKTELSKVYEKAREEHAVRTNAEIEAMLKNISMPEMLAWFQARNIGISLEGLAPSARKLNLFAAYSAMRELPPGRAAGTTLYFDDSNWGDVHYDIPSDSVHFSIPSAIRRSSVSEVNLRSVKGVVLHEFGHRWNHKELNPQAQRAFVEISWNWNRFLEFMKYQSNPQKGVIHLMSPRLDADPRDFVVDSDSISGWTSADEEMATIVEYMYHSHNHVMEKAIDNLVRFADPDLAQKIYFGYGYYGRVLSPDLWIVRGDNAPLNQDEGIYVYKKDGIIHRVEIKKASAGGYEAVSTILPNYNPQPQIKRLEEWQTRPRSELRAKKRIQRVPQPDFNKPSPSQSKRGQFLTRRNFFIAAITGGTMLAAGGLVWKALNKNTPVETDDQIRAKLVEMSSELEKEFDKGSAEYEAVDAYMEMLRTQQDIFPEEMQGHRVIAGTFILAGHIQGIGFHREKIKSLLQPERLEDADTRTVVKAILIKEAMYIADTKKTVNYILRHAFAERFINYVNKYKKIPDFGKFDMQDTQLVELARRFFALQMDTELRPMMDTYAYLKRHGLNRKDRIEGVKLRGGIDPQIASIFEFVGMIRDESEKDVRKFEAWNFISINLAQPRNTDVRVATEIVLQNEQTEGRVKYAGGQLQPLKPSFLDFVTDPNYYKYPEYEEDFRLGRIRAQLLPNGEVKIIHEPRSELRSSGNGVSEHAELNLSGLEAKWEGAWDNSPAVLKAEKNVTVPGPEGTPIEALKLESYLPKSFSGYSRELKRPADLSLFNAVQFWIKRERGEATRDDIELETISQSGPHRGGRQLLRGIGQIQDVTNEWKLITLPLSEVMPGPENYKGVTKISFVLKLPWMSSQNAVFYISDMRAVFRPELAVSSQVSSADQILEAYRKGKLRGSALGDRLDRTTKDLAAEWKARVPVLDEIKGQMTSKTLDYIHHEANFTTVADPGKKFVLKYIYNQYDSGDPAFDYGFKEGQGLQWHVIKSLESIEVFGDSAFGYRIYVTKDVLNQLMQADADYFQRQIDTGLLEVMEEPLKIHVAGIPEKYPIPAGYSRPSQDTPITVKVAMVQPYITFLKDTIREEASKVDLDASVRVSTINNWLDAFSQARIKFWSQGLYVIGLRPGDVGVDETGNIRVVDTANYRPIDLSTGFPATNDPQYVLPYDIDLLREANHKGTFETLSKLEKEFGLGGITRHYLKTEKEYGGLSQFQTSWHSGGYSNIENAQRQIIDDFLRSGIQPADSKYLQDLLASRRSELRSEADYSAMPSAVLLRHIGEVFQSIVDDRPGSRASERRYEAILMLTELQKKGTGALETIREAYAAGGTLKQFSPEISGPIAGVLLFIAGKDANDYAVLQKVEEVLELLPEPHWPGAAAQLNLAKTNVAGLISRFRSELRGNRQERPLDLDQTAADLLKSYVHEFITNPERAPYLVQNESELMESLVDPRRISIALRPIPPTPGQTHTDWFYKGAFLPFSKFQRNFLNGLDPQILKWLFSAKILTGDRERSVRDFLVKNRDEFSKLGPDEKEFFLGLNAADDLKSQGVALESLVDHSSSRGLDEGNVVYEITLRRNAAAFSFFLKGFSNFQKRKSEREGRQGEKYETFYFQLIHLLGLPSIKAAYYRDDQDTSLYGFNLMQKIPGQDANKIFDVDDNLTFQIKKEIRPYRNQLIAEWAGLAAIADLIHKGDRVIVQNGLSQFQANHLIDLERLKSGASAISSIDNQYLFNRTNYSPVSDLDRAARAEMGIVTAFPEFSSAEGRDELFGIYEAAYRKSWEKLQNKRQDIESLIIRTFGPESYEERVFSESSNESAAENLQQQKAALLTFVGGKLPFRSELRSAELTSAEPMTIAEVKELLNRVFFHSEAGRASLAFSVSEKQDLEYSLAFAEEALKHPIQKILVVGAGLHFLPLVMALLGKESVYLDAADDPVKFMEIKKKEVERTLGRTIPLRAVKGEIGTVDFQSAGLEEGSFDLVTLFDLIGGIPVGDPESWLDQSRRLLKPEGYIVIDEEKANRSGASITDHFSGIFPEHELLAGGKFFQGTYHGQDRFYRVKALPADRTDLTRNEHLQALDIYPFYEELARTLKLSSEEQTLLEDFILNQAEYPFAFRGPTALVSLAWLLFSPHTDGRLIEALETFEGTPGLISSLQATKIESQAGLLAGIYFARQLENQESGLNIEGLSVKTRLEHGGSEPDALIADHSDRLNPRVYLAEFKNFTGKKSLDDLINNVQMKKYIKAVMGAEDESLYPPYIFSDRPSGILLGLGESVILNRDREDTVAAMQGKYDKLAAEAREELKKKGFTIAAPYAEKNPPLIIHFLKQPGLIADTPEYKNPFAIRDAERWNNVKSNLERFYRVWKGREAGVSKPEMLQYFNRVEPDFYDSVMKDKENGGVLLYERYMKLADTAEARIKIIREALRSELRGGRQIFSVSSGEDMRILYDLIEQSAKRAYDQFKPAANVQVLRYFVEGLPFHQIYPGVLLEDANGKEIIFMPVEMFLAKPLDRNIEVFQGFLKNQAGVDAPFDQLTLSAENHDGDIRTGGEKTILYTLRLNMPTAVRSELRTSSEMKAVNEKIRRDRSAEIREAVLSRGIDKFKAEIERAGKSDLDYFVYRLTLRRLLYEDPALSEYEKILNDPKRALERPAYYKRTFAYAFVLKTEELFKKDRAFYFQQPTVSVDINTLRLSEKNLGTILPISYEFNNNREADERLIFNPHFYPDSATTFTPGEDDPPHVQQRKIYDLLIQESGGKFLLDTLKDITGETSFDMASVKKIMTAEIQSGIFQTVHIVLVNLADGRLIPFALLLARNSGEKSKVTENDFRNLWAHRDHKYISRVIRLGETAGTKAYSAEYLNSFGEVLFELEGESKYSDVRTVMKTTGESFGLFKLNTLHHLWGGAFLPERSEAVLASMIKTFVYHSDVENGEMPDGFRIAAGDLNLTKTQVLPQYEGNSTRLDPGSFEPEFTLITWRSTLTGINARSFLSYLFKLRYLFDVVYDVAQQEAAPDWIAQGVLEGFKKGLIEKYGREKGLRLTREWLSGYDYEAAAREKRPGYRIFTRDRIGKFIAEALDSEASSAEASAAFSPRSELRSGMTRRDALKRMTAAGVIAAVSGNFNEAAAQRARRKKFVPSARPDFTKDFKLEDLLKNKDTAEKFLANFFTWGGRFAQFARDETLGVTGDGIELDFATGDITNDRQFSAPSKEALDISMLTFAILGDKRAAMWASPDNPALAEKAALEVLTKRIETYLRFYQEYPGFGGFLPWYEIAGENGVLKIKPVGNRPDEVHGIDNGQLWASLKALHWALLQKKHTALAGRYLSYIRLLERNAAMVFYNGNGKIRGEVKVKNVKARASRDNYSQLVTAGKPGYFLDTPNEGEAMAVLIDLYGRDPVDVTKPFNARDKDLIWADKRRNLNRVEFETPAGVITGRRDSSGSNHNPWNYIAGLPYQVSPTAWQIFQNNQKIVTWWSAMNKIPGLFAAAHVPHRRAGEKLVYEDKVGARPIGFEDARQDFAASYATGPVLVAARSANQLQTGAAWLYISAEAPNVQTPVGLAEAYFVDGSGVTPFIGWDGSIYPLIGILGGLGPVTEKAFAADKTLDAFRERMESYFGPVFQNINGVNVPFATPTARVNKKAAPAQPQARAKKTVFDVDLPEKFQPDFEKPPLVLDLRGKSELVGGLPNKLNLRKLLDITSFNDVKKLAEFFKLTEEDPGSWSPKMTDDDIRGYWNKQRLRREELMEKFFWRWHVRELAAYKKQKLGTQGDISAQSEKAYADKTLKAFIPASSPRSELRADSKDPGSALNEIRRQLAQEIMPGSRVFLISEKLQELVRVVPDEMVTEALSRVPDSIIGFLGLSLQRYVSAEKAVITGAGVRRISAKVRSSAGGERMITVLGLADIPSDMMKQYEEGTLSQINGYLPEEQRLSYSAGEVAGFSRFAILQSIGESIWDGLPDKYKFQWLVEEPSSGFFFDRNNDRGQYKKIEIPSGGALVSVPEARLNFSRIVFGDYYAAYRNPELPISRLGKIGETQIHFFEEIERFIDQEMRNKEVLPGTYRSESGAKKSPEPRAAKPTPEPIKLETLRTLVTALVEPLNLSIPNDKKNKDAAVVQTQRKESLIDSLATRLSLTGTRPLSEALILEALKESLRTLGINYGNAVQPLKLRGKDAMSALIQPIVTAARGGIARSELRVNTDHFEPLKVDVYRREKIESLLDIISSWPAPLQGRYASAVEALRTALAAGSESDLQSVLSPLREALSLKLTIEEVEKDITVSWKESVLRSWNDLRSSAVAVIDRMLADSRFVDAWRKSETQPVRLGLIHFSGGGYSTAAGRSAFGFGMDKVVQGWMKDWSTDVNGLVLSNLTFSTDVDIVGISAAIIEKYLPNLADKRSSLITIKEALKNAAIWGNKNGVDNLIILHWKFENGELVLDITDQSSLPISYTKIQPAPPNTIREFYGEREGFRKYIQPYVDKNYFGSGYYGPYYDFPVKDAAGNRVGQNLRLRLPYVNRAAAGDPRSELRETAELVVRVISSSQISGSETHAAAREAAAASNLGMDGFVRELRISANALIPQSTRIVDGFELREAAAKQGELIKPDGIYIPDQNITAATEDLIAFLTAFLKTKSPDGKIPLVLDIPDTDDAADALRNDYLPNIFKLSHLLRRLQVHGGVKGRAQAELLDVYRHLNWTPSFIKNFDQLKPDDSGKSIPSVVAGSDAVYSGKNPYIFSVGLKAEEIRDPRARTYAGLLQIVFSIVAAADGVKAGELERNPALKAELLKKMTLLGQYGGGLVQFTANGQALISPAAAERFLREYQARLQITRSA